MSFLQLQQQTREKCQEIWDRQVQNLSAVDGEKTKATLKHIVTLIHLQKLKIGKAGITEGIVNGIHERWRRTVLVKIVYEDLSRLNMRICLFFCSIQLLLTNTTKYYLLPNN